MFVIKGVWIEIQTQITPSPNAVMFCGVRVCVLLERLVVILCMMSYKCSVLSRSCSDEYPDKQSTEEPSKEAPAKTLIARKRQSISRDASN